MGNAHSRTLLAECLTNVGSEDAVFRDELAQVLRRYTEFFALVLDLVCFMDIDPCAIRWTTIALVI